MQKILDQLERDYRESVPRVFHAPSTKELAIVSLLSFLSAPFISSTFLLIPLIGQGLVFFFSSLVLIYLYVRRSWKVMFAAMAAHLAFIIPAVAVIPSFRNHLDIAYFLLLATGIPVIIILGLFVASRIWFEIESRDKNINHGNN